jgi:hypothetical protein
VPTTPLIIVRMLASTAGDMAAVTVSSGAHTLMPTPINPTPTATAALCRGNGVCNHPPRRAAIPVAKNARSNGNDPYVIGMNKSEVIANGPVITA